MRIAIFSTKPYDIEYLNKFNINNKHQLTFFDVPLNIASSQLSKGFNAVCVFVNDKLDAPLIEQLALNDIKLIVLRSAGFNNVDIPTAVAKNIKVLRVPAYSPQAVAEHAVALILTLNRKTHKAYNRVKESNFSLSGLMGFNLNNKTVGVIGTGKIGSAFCKIMQGFNCKVIAYDIKEKEILKEQGILYTSLDEVLKNADIISLHCPLTPETKHLFNAATFSKMKQGAMLINSSRGALINTVDVIAALKSGKLGHLGMDVYEQEENLFFKDLSETIIQDDLIERLITFPNVLINPHQGFFTKEALDEIAITTIKNCSDFEDELPLENEIKSL
jgi:D-lactate dehydrogenase